MNKEFAKIVYASYLDSIGDEVSIEMLCEQIQMEMKDNYEIEVASNDLSEY